jgi:hypothetical protein
LAGVIAIETSVGALTVSVVEPEIEPELAVMDVLPTAIPVANPAVLIVATPVAEEAQLTELVMFCVLPSEYVPVAVNCSVVPAAIDGFAGVTAIETRLAAVPVPLRDTVCGLLFALSVKVSVPVRAFNCFGEKVTDAVQLAPAPSVLGLIGQLEVYVKSVGVMLMLVIFSVVD